MTKENLPNDEEMPSDEEDSTEASDEESTSEQAADEEPKEDDPSDDYFELLRKEKDRIDAEMGLAKLIAVGAGLLGFGPIVYAVQVHLQTPYRFGLAELGTFVGGTSGPLWSLAALAALYLGFLAQRRDSEQQREAFEKQQKAQTKRFEREQFENTFFRLLDVYEEVSQNLVMEKTNGEVVPIIYKMEHLIERKALHRRTEKYLKHDDFDFAYSAERPDKIKFIDVRDESVNYPDHISTTTELLDEEEKEEIVREAHKWLHSTNSDKFQDFLNVLVLIIDLFERTDNDQVPVDRYQMLLRSRMKNNDRRIIYWMTYNNVDNEVVYKLQEYELSNIEMPSDFTSLDKAYT